MTLNKLPTVQTRIWLTGLSTLVAATLVACGGGGSADSSASASGTGTQTYSGTVSGLGSIVVNGVRFSTTGAETQDGDDPSQPYSSSFKLGATVVVTGSVNGTDGQAASIEIVGGVRGQVSAADATAGTLTVAGQAIKVDTNTVFDGEGDATFSLASIAAGFGSSAIYVEVYGTADETGTILATRIEKKDPAALIFALKAPLDQVITFSILSGLLGYTFMPINMFRFRSKWPLDTIKRGYIHPFHPIPSIVLLTPLALTSFNRAIKALGGRRWQMLHKLVYAVAVLAVVHFFWMRAGKNNFAEVAVYAAILGSLLAWRVAQAMRKNRLQAPPAARNQL